MSSTQPSSSSTSSASASSSASAQMVAHTSQANCVDPLDAMIDFSEYEQVSYQQSPSLSPSQSKSHAQFNTRTVSQTPPMVQSSQPVLSGPSHNYDMYRQQTGIPQGAMANTLAVNSNNMHINQYGFADNGFLSGLSPSDDFVDFGTAPGRSFSSSDNDMEFDSPDAEPAFFYPEQAANEFIDPSAIGGGQSAPVLAPPAINNVGRLYPGVHQHQAALAKAQAQQKQQQQIIQQQRQMALAGQSAQQPQRTRGSAAPTDPVVEERISRLLNSMRQSSVATDGDDMNSGGNMSNAQRIRKDEEDMDEDERLLASEEGKKLSSKERRQLRNKVSARAFRSRRKEYIGQLEGEIAQKVNENSDLRSQNRALMDENNRLSDLTRMLLSSPSFSGFLDTLSQNPAAQAPSAPVQQQQQQQQQQVERKVRKDVNPYSAPQHMQQQQIGMTMIPEQHMDFSMLDLNSNGFSYQPQVFSVLSMPETILDAETLSGKAPAAPTMASDDVKVEIPAIERVAPVTPVETVSEVDEEEFESDPAFALFSASSTPTASKPQELDISDLLASIPSKPIQYTLLVESSVNDDVADAALRRVERLSSRLDRLTESISNLGL